MGISEIKLQLPTGSYGKIADRIGKSEQSVRMFFSEKTSVRLSQNTEELILEEAMKIIEENGWRSLALNYGEEAIIKMKAALAA